MKASIAMRYNFLLNLANIIAFYGMKGHAYKRLIKNYKRSVLRRESSAKGVMFGIAWGIN
jgi:hypothetical protein